MKYLIVLALAVVAVIAAPPTGDVTLLKSDFVNEQSGYNFG